MSHPNPQLTYDDPTVEDKKETPAQEISLTEKVSQPREAVKSFDPEALIAKAIENNVPVETMERLLVMRRELKAEWAKEQFDLAMAEFQAECPVIEKGKKVDFTSKRTGTRTTYNYAPLDEIVRQVGPVIAKNGLSYTIETENTPTMIASIVKVKHISGHSESTRFEVPIDKESYMNAQQQYGAASTFGKRYAFCNAFGILTGDEDTDAKDIEETIPTNAPTKTIKPVIKVEADQSFAKPTIKSSTPITDKQDGLISKLMQDKGLSTEYMIDQGFRMPALTMTKAEASEAIEFLLSPAAKSKIVNGKPIARPEDDAPPISDDEMPQ